VLLRLRRRERAVGVWIRRDRGRDRHEIPLSRLGEDKVGELVPTAQDAEDFAPVTEDEEKFL
jgi:hypothetical protein